MKKLFLAASVFFILSVYISVQAASYEDELEKIKKVKNAQISAIDKKIKDRERKIENIKVLSNLPKSQKEQKIKAYEKEIDTLSLKKNDIKHKYNKDKAKLKALYN